MALMNRDGAPLSHTRRWQSYAAALLIVAAASGIRALVFADLARGTPYLTYFPAVMLAALYGGLYAGLLATAASAALSYYWIQMGWLSRVETLAMGAFIISCMMISAIAEAMLRAKAREKLERLRAEAANAAKSMFLARMSHELRTPLNAILGFTDLLRRDRDVSGDSRKILDIINRSGEHLLALINDVLDMAKIDAGRMVLQPAAVDLCQLVRETTDLMRMRAESKMLRLTLDQSPQMSCFVRTDAAKLRQIIINLVGNAIKFTDRGSVTLRVGTQPGDDARRELLVIEVEDTGIGISAADQERLFGPFFQAGGVAREKGTGLGLAITKRFVELMDGRVSVRSTFGSGSCFRVELPVDVAAAADIAAPAEQSGQVVGLAPNQPDHRILIVDDEAENSELLRRLMEPVGFQVRIAENGLAGVEAFSAWHPDFIWMDLRMPVIDGLEATRRIRALPGGRGAKIVAITASAFEDEIDRVKAAGMDDLVRKPYRADEIFDCLGRYLGVAFTRVAHAAGNAGGGQAVTLGRDAVVELPAALRDQLCDALIALDATKIAAAIDHIAKVNPPLGEMLRQHAAQFNYTAILQALDYRLVTRAAA